jgi:hypothetical protein
VNACKSHPNPKKLLIAQILHKKASVCIPFGFTKGTSVKNSYHTTVVDVARKVGVSCAVSQELNNKRNIKPEMLERVWTAFIYEKGGVYLSQ